MGKTIVVGSALPESTSLVHSTHYELSGDWQPPAMPVLGDPTVSSSLQGPLYTCDIQSCRPSLVLIWKGV